VAFGHYQFETLHPFSDGNGWFCRLVVTLQLIEAEKLGFPLLNLAEWLEPRKDEYQENLLKRSVDSDSTSAFVHGSVHRTCHGFGVDENWATTLFSWELATICPRVCPATDRETSGSHPRRSDQEALVTRSFVVNGAGRRSDWIKLIIRCSGCAALAGQPYKVVENPRGRGG
jgi:hypothetical protein